MASLMASLAGWQEGIVWGLAVLALITFTSTIFQTNPYGRHMQANQRFTMPARPAWLLFECPQWWAFTLTFWMAFWLEAESPSAPAVLLYALWQSHYLYRAIVYPLRKRDDGKRFPISGVVFGFVFNTLNGFVNGYAVAYAPHLVGNSWFTDPRFLLGLLIAVSGWLINFQSDSILIRLRSDGFDGYRIPYGGLYRWISCPNYFGEILLWSGWAMMSWTWAGLVFALFSVSNLLPRAMSHHRWYREKFADYPQERKALIPGLL